MASHPDLLQRMRALIDDAEAKHAASVDAMRAVLAEREALERSIAAATKYKTESAFVDMDVSGTRFRTSKDTLMQCPPDSVLHTIASGMVEPVDGKFFLDRPSKPFRTILTALQVGQYRPSDKRSTRELVELELRFYGLEEMELFGGGASSIAGCSIVSDEQLQTVRSWLDELPPGMRADEWKLVYRASRDGWQAHQFRDRLPNGPVLVMVRGEDGSVFGGFASDLKAASMAGCFVEDERAFIYQLRSSTGSWVNERLVRKFNRHHLYAHPSCLAGWGNGNDLVIPENAHTSLVEAITSTYGALSNGVAVTRSQRATEIEMFCHA